MEERFAPSRPIRLGTRRRALRKSARSSAEGGFARAKRAASLDTKKQPETTVRNWLSDQYTEKDRHIQKAHIHARLKQTVHAIWQGYMRQSETEDGMEWMRAYEQQFRVRDGENMAERAQRIKAWRKANPPRGLTVKALKWERQWVQLHNCQKEWIAYYADCCKGYTAPVAVPVGCNHRLCPLCAHHRSQRAQKRIRTMYPRLTHPALITLTVPNLPSIHKKHFEHFRKRVRQFIAQHETLINGGVYSLECTFNRRERTWHLHVHILADLSHQLPPEFVTDPATGKRKRNTVRFGCAPDCKRNHAHDGQTWLKFTALKRRLEFDWMRLWYRQWGKKARKNASTQSREGDTYQFETWLRLTRLMRTRTHNGRFRTDLPAEQLQLCFEWNKANRMTVDIRPVIDRDGAAREVLKYITKGANFADLPEAVEPFCDAAKGARMIQTFGSWYGVKLDGDETPKERSEYLGQCSCGVCAWKRLGVFHHGDVAMEPDGRWRVRRPYDWKSPGTVPRPTIRALDVREGSLSYANSTGIELESR